MERIISLSDLQKAVDSAYEKYKSIKEGEVDSRVSGVDAKTFGIAVVLADGTVITKADADTKVPIGGIIRVPVASILLAQNSVEELMKKSGCCSCACGGNKPEKPKAGVCARGVRAVSAVEPTGDPDSKWNFIENQMINMMGTAPTLDVKLYEAMKAQTVADKAVDAFAEAGYYLYDDAASSIDLYTRGQAMTASARQLAVMGATIIAGGVNPVTKQIVFDNEIAPRLTAMMAAKGPHKMRKGWLVASGVPAVSSFGGAILGVVPGVMSIAVCSPEVNEAGVSVKGAKAIIDIMNSLKISAFSNECIKIDTKK